ncbi:hypothetical protein AA313_de0206523 [Arthrobotrys entomopaga]|nr:hypothetical protein AA313_de0206523 [Arthrobotrys entomopaga]
MLSNHPRAAISSSYNFKTLTCSSFSHAFGRGLKPFLGFNMRSKVCDASRKADSVAKNPYLISFSLSSISIMRSGSLVNHMNCIPAQESCYILPVYLVVLRMPETL